MFSELNAKWCSGLLSHTIGQVVKLPQWWWESAQFTSMLKWVAVPAELQHWEVEQEGAVSTCSQFLQSVLAVSTCIVQCRPFTCKLPQQGASNCLAAWGEQILIIWSNKYASATRLPKVQSRQLFLTGVHPEEEVGTDEQSFLLPSCFRIWGSDQFCLEILAILKIWYESPEQCCN